MIGSIKLEIYELCIYLYVSSESELVGFKVKAYN